MARCSSIVLASCMFVLAPACLGSSDDPPATDEPVGPGWESATTTTDDGSIIIQKVAYRSGGLRIFGQVCRPVGPGPFPLIVANHGGVTGLPAWNGGACAEAARGGYVRIEPSFRGQDGSGGVVELCRGEVDDALRMLELALAMPEVDRERVVMWGESLGGCITTRALQRGAPVKAAASVSGISNMKAAYEFWRNQLESGAGPTVQYRILLEAATIGIGGPPDEFPDDYDLRSPALSAAEIPAEIPFLIAHGADDLLVPARQSCELAQRLSVRGHHLNEQHQLVATAPADCSPVWTPSTAPIGSWPASRYLLVYEGLAQATGDTATVMDVDVESFLAAKLR